MEYRFTQKLFGYFYHNSCMKQAKAQHLSLDNKAIKNEYKAVLERADDIGKSHLMSSYCMGAYFIALNRKTSLSPEECFSLYKDGLYNNKLFHMVIGNADSYLDEKKLPGRKKWSEESHLRRYKNDWVLDIIEGGPNDDFILGYDYHNCSISHRIISSESGNSSAFPLLYPPYALMSHLPNTFLMSSSLAVCTSCSKSFGSVFLFAMCVPPIFYSTYP